MFVCFLVIIFSDFSSLFVTACAVCLFTRVFVGIMVLISIAWIPLIDQAQGGQLYLYIKSIAAYLAPPIAAVYTMAVLWKRMNETVRAGSR